MDGVICLLGRGRPLTAWASAMVQIVTEPSAATVHPGLWATSHT